MRSAVNGASSEVRFYVVQRRVEQHRDFPIFMRGIGNDKRRGFVLASLLEVLVSRGHESSGGTRKDELRLAGFALYTGRQEREINQKLRRGSLQDLAFYVVNRIPRLTRVIVGRNPHVQNIALHAAINALHLRHGGKRRDD